MKLSAFASMNTGKTYSQLLLEDALKKTGSNKALADRLGVNTATVKRWKKGTQKIFIAQYAEIEKIAHGDNSLGLYSLIGYSSPMIPYIDPEHPSNWKKRRRDGKPMFVYSSAKNFKAKEYCRLKAMN